jgi:hypothetical protein
MMSKINPENTNTTLSNKDKEEFLRLVIFLKDRDKILAIFPFHHILNDEDFNELIENYGDEIDKENIKKNDFCLMYEKKFGWGWIYKEFVNLMEPAKKEEYIPMASYLIMGKLINANAILNEDWKNDGE